MKLRSALYSGKLLCYFELLEGRDKCRVVEGIVKDLGEVHRQVSSVRPHVGPITIRRRCKHFALLTSLSGSIRVVFQRTSTVGPLTTCLQSSGALDMPIRFSLTHAAPRGCSQSGMDAHIRYAHSAFPHSPLISRSICRSSNHIERLWDVTD